MFNHKHCNIRGLFIHIHFAKQVFLHICQQILLVSSIKLYMPTTTKTKLNIRHSIHVRIQHDNLLIAFGIFKFLHCIKLI